MKVRSEILRLYQALHTWTGIVAGTLLFIGFFGGALTMFKAPLERCWASPPARAEAPAGAVLDRLVMDVLAMHPAARAGFTLHLQGGEHVPAPLSWTEGEGERELDLGAQVWLAATGPDGPVIRHAPPVLVGALVDMLHRSAGIPGQLGGEYLGVYLMGVAGALYFLALVSGLVLALPTLVKDFFAVRRGKNRKRFWLDIHNVLGIASLPFHIVISLTVVVFAFHDQFYGALQQVVYGARPLFVHPHPGAVPRDVAHLLPVSELVRRARAAAPGFAPVEMEYMGLEGPRPMVRVAIDGPRDMVQAARSGFLMLEPYTGAILDTSMVPGRRGTYSAIVTGFFALHFGSYGGLTTRWVYFAAGLAGAFLFYSGNLLWIEKRREQLRGSQPDAAPPQPRHTRMVAAASVGVCLGSMAGVAAALVSCKWLHAAGLDVNAGCVAVYYAVFLGCVGWAFAAGAARASIHLLGLCAVLALALPATGLVARLLPQTGLWAPASPAAAAVDLVALLAAMLLWQATRLTARRVRTGPPDSVWSALPDKEKSPAT